MINLDREALIIAQNIVNSLPGGKKKVKEMENQLTKGLGILTESGVYALFVYLLAKRKKDKNGKLDPDDPCHKILTLFLGTLSEKDKNEDLLAILGLKKDRLLNPTSGEQILKWALDLTAGPDQQVPTGQADKGTVPAREQTADLHRLLLLRDFLVRVFTYGRYCAAAREVELGDGAGKTSGGGTTP